MYFNVGVRTAFCAFLGLNMLIALVFWLHDVLRSRAHSKLKTAVEKAVRAVEQFCATLENAEKKRQAVLRVEALLGWYRWVIPSLVVDTAIEAEIYVIRQIQQKLGVENVPPQKIIRKGGE